MEQHHRDTLQALRHRHVGFAKEAIKEGGEVSLQKVPVVGKSLREVSDPSRGPEPLCERDHFVHHPGPSVLKHTDRNCVKPDHFFRHDKLS